MTPDQVEPPQPSRTPGDTTPESGTSPPSSPATKSSPPTPPPGNPANDERSDEALLSAHLLGEPDALKTLISRYQRELVQFLYRFMGDHAAAEDVFQEAFLQVHQSAPQFDSERRFKPWLFTIAANKARDAMRSAARRPTTPLQASVDGSADGKSDFLSLMASSEERPDQVLERDELRARVQAVVMSMPTNLREILLLSYFNEFPYKQISEILEIPVGTVKSRLHSAVAYFAQRWRNSNPETPEA